MLECSGTFWNNLEQLGDSGGSFNSLSPTSQWWSLRCSRLQALKLIYRSIVSLFLSPSLRLFIHGAIAIDEEDLEKAEEHEGWETIILDGQTYSVRTSIMDKKCQAFETLVIYCSTLGAQFSPYLAQTQDVTLPCLQFYFHEGVRESCAMYIPRRFFQLFLTNVFPPNPNAPFLRQAKQHAHESNHLHHIPNNLNMKLETLVRC